MTLQFLPVIIPVLLALYDTLHPLNTSTRESQAGLIQVSVGFSPLFVLSIGLEKFNQCCSCHLSGNVGCTILLEVKYLIQLI